MGVGFGLWEGVEWNLGFGYIPMDIPIACHAPAPFGHASGERTKNLYSYSWIHEPFATPILRALLPGPRPRTPARPKPKARDANKEMAWELVD